MMLKKKHTIYIYTHTCIYVCDVCDDIRRSFVVYYTICVHAKICVNPIQFIRYKISI